MFSASFEDNESDKQLVLIAMLENILSIFVLFSVIAALYQTNISFNTTQNTSKQAWKTNPPFFRDTLYNLKLFHKKKALTWELGNVLCAKWARP